MKIINNKENLAILSALLSAVLYAISIPFAKMLSPYISLTMFGGLLYLGGGLGLFAAIMLKRGRSEISLTRKEIPYIVCMVLLDIGAILCLMAGIANTTAANASLLGNFEFAATVLAAFFIFKERITKRLLIAVVLIIIASIILTFEGSGSFIFNKGSALVILACVFWGLENNITRILSIKDTRQITMIKGICSAIGVLVTGFILGENLPPINRIILIMLLGFISYGISICLYVYAQRYIGASKTAAIYSYAPYFGCIFSLLLLKEIPLLQFYPALVIMLVATVLI